MGDVSCVREATIHELMAEMKKYEKLANMAMVGTNNAYDGVVEWKWNWSIATVLQVTHKAFREQ